MLITDRIYWLQWEKQSTVKLSTKLANSILDVLAKVRGWQGNVASEIFFTGQGCRAGVEAARKNGNNSSTINLIDFDSIIREDKISFSDKR